MAKLKRPQYQRNLRLKEAALKLRVSAATIWLWIKKGAPHDVVPKPSGGLPINLVNLDELKLWLLAQQFRGQREGRKALRTLVPVEEVKSLIQEARKTLGWTKLELAESLDITSSRLNGYLHPHLFRIKFAPKNLISQLTHLIKYGVRHRHPHQMPTKEEVISALKKSGGIKSAAARRLALHDSTINKLIKKYDLYTYLHRSLDEIITKKQLKEILIESKGNLEEASRKLKISSESVESLAKKAGFSKLIIMFRKIKSSERRQKYNRIKEALRLAHGNIHRASRKSGIKIDSIRAILKRSRALRRFRAKLKSHEQQQITAALVETKGNLTKAARKLKMMVSELKHYLRWHGLG